MILLVLSIAAYSVWGFPVRPSQYYGDVVIDGSYADVGTNITIYDNNGVLCGYFSTDKGGEYIVSCKGDNSETSKDEGANEGEFVSFYVNERKVGTNAKWNAEGFMKLDLRVGVEIIEEYEIEKLSEKNVSGDMYLMIILFLVIMVFAFYNIRKIKSR